MPPSPSSQQGWFRILALAGAGLWTLGAWQGWKPLRTLSFRLLVALGERWRSDRQQAFLDRTAGKDAGTVL